MKLSYDLFSTEEKTKTNAAIFYELNSTIYDIFLCTENAFSLKYSSQNCEYLREKTLCTWKKSDL